MFSTADGRLCSIAPVNRLRKFTLCAAIVTCLLLQGCLFGEKESGDKGSSGAGAPSQKAEPLQPLGPADTAALRSCSKTCRFSALYGRWHSPKNGHLCWNTEREEFTCQCTASPARPPSCESRPPGVGSLVHLHSVEKVAKVARRHLVQPQLTRARCRYSGGDWIDLKAPFSASVLDVKQKVNDSSSIQGAEPAADGSGSRGITPRQTIKSFCSHQGLREMHGATVEGELEDVDAVRDIESKILGDVARELEQNNVDKMAKDIFSFYVCARWVPDSTFWKLAEQELAAQLFSSVMTDEETLSKAIAKLYQNYKFVPLLCSQNLEVFQEMDVHDMTHFSAFRRKVKELSSWLGQSQSSLVGKSLTEVDKLFCGTKAMNSRSCGANLNFNKEANKFLDYFGFKANLDTHESQWERMEKIFLKFGMGDNKTWNKDFASWKSRFPFHSFIGKPKGMPVDASPLADERFVICFGKRVASELHRRPGGQHILTDQNNIGCHGWWTADMAGQMLDRILGLWKPPTCQLANMVYHMKREILSMFRQMNERLFDALPSMLTDEMLEEESRAEGNTFNFEDHQPKPFQRQSLVVNGAEFVDSMRVQSLVSMSLPKGCLFFCPHRVTKGDYGVVHILSGRLSVIWDRDSNETAWRTDPAAIQILPLGWTNPKGFQGHVSDLVAGISKITDAAKELFGSIFQRKQTGLAEMMSESVSKWAVCPLKDSADQEGVDAYLGVEDAAFQDFQKEAYSYWTGYKKEIPGSQCVAVAKGELQLSDAFSGFASCDISELHADHVEKYITDNGQPEGFICPLRPPLPADEQLEVLREQGGVCFMRMTERQARQHDWHYRGSFPSRRQHDPKANTPLEEYELVKLLKVPGGGQDAQVSFGRYCSLEELRTGPHLSRFCDLAPLHNRWNSVEELAKSLAIGVAGSLGVGGAALANAVKAYQTGLKNVTAAEAALTVSDYAWGALLGAGRLAESTGKKVKTLMQGSLPGTKRIKGELETRLLGEKAAGELLHELSFQRHIGRSKADSNSKERYQRYVMRYPCKDFNPALAFTLRRAWGTVALRMLAEAQRIHSRFLDRPSLELQLRGEARVFETRYENSDNATWAKFGSAMRLAKNGFSDWWVVSDGKLSTAVGGEQFEVGQVGDDDLRALKSLSLSVYCGQKRDFGPKFTEPPARHSLGGTLRTCLDNGVEVNARLQAKQPWKEYFSEEVVVVFAFDASKQRRCLPRQTSTTTYELCMGGAAVTKGLDSHIPGKDKSSTDDNKYLGIFTGAGHPQGTLSEVVLKPEDVLESLGLLPESGERLDGSSSLQTEVSLDSGDEAQS